jgi:xanthine/CO dehydrogenase XdhC/CoxF family maturation factor
MEPWERAKQANYTRRLRRLEEWSEEVSRIRINDPIGDQIDFKLYACGVGTPEESLDISVRGVPGMRLTFGIDARQIERLAEWLIEAMYLTHSLRERKERQVQKAEKLLAVIHDHNHHHEWSRKAAE